MVWNWYTVDALLSVHNMAHNFRRHVRGLLRRCHLSCHPARVLPPRAEGIRPTDRLGVYLGRWGRVVDSCPMKPATFDDGKERKG